MKDGVEPWVAPGRSDAERAIERRNGFLLLAVAAYLILFYALTNYFPLREPRSMPSFPFESRIGLTPWTCWIYLSYFVLLIVTGVRLRRCSWTPRAVGAVAVVATLSGVVFLVYPTTITRPPFFGDGLSATVLRGIRALDPPNNCFPSQHVGMAISCALLMIFLNRRTGILVLLWAAAVAASTLTTKQHYFLDILGGLVTAGIGLTICFGGPTGILRRLSARPFPGEEPGSSDTQTSAGSSSG